VIKEGEKEHLEDNRPKYQFWIKFGLSYLQHIIRSMALQLGFEYISYPEKHQQYLNLMMAN